MGDIAMYAVAVVLCVIAGIAFVLGIMWDGRYENFNPNLLFWIVVGFLALGLGGFAATVWSFLIAGILMYSFYAGILALMLWDQRGKRKK